MFHSKNRLHRSLMGVLWLFVLLVAAIVPAQAQTVTVTDENGIVYDIVDKAKMTVKVSATNATQLASAANLKDVVIPATVTDHSTSATTTEPWTVIGMADRAFQKAAGLRSITIEAPLTEIANFTFNDCASLESVTLPQTVKSLGQHSFSQCPKLKSITGIDNVITIASYAFYRCSSLTDITLPSTLTLLQADAFQECTSLERITIPGSVKELQASTFQDCTSLAEVILEEGVQIIGQRAFQGCTSLVHPAFPASLQRLDPYAFAKCDNLGTVTIQHVYYSNLVYSEATIQEIVFPESDGNPTPYIGNNLFEKVKGLTEINVTGFDALPDGTFLECPDLTTVTLAEGFKTVGNYAFQKCPKLTTVSIPSTLEYIGHYAFSECPELEGITFPAVMETIGNYAFQKCPKLDNIVLPAGVQFGTCVFNQCNLSSITFPEEPMVSMADDPFGRQPNIKSMTVPGWLETVPNGIFSDWDALTSITFEEGVKVLGYNLAFSCDNLTTITLPATLTTITGATTYGSKGAFQACPKLVNILLTAPSDTNGKFPDSLTDIGAYAFSGCPGLTSITLPANLEEIGYNAFSNCSNLELPSFPETLKTIGTEAFLQCKKDGTVTLHAGMSIGSQAFAQCNPVAINLPDKPCFFGDEVFLYNTNITQFTFPDWMTEIPGGFCEAWNKLETIVLPAGVTEIGEKAFRGCTSLHDVNLPPSIKLLDKNCFAQCGSVSQPFGSITLYEGTKVADNAFESTTLTEIIFEGCSDFGKNVFNNVTTIEKIAFPACMDTIPQGFCQNWRNLKEVTLPEGIKKISKNVFFGCTALTSVTIPASMDSICDYAFFNSGLESIVWPETGVKGFGKNALSNCKFQSFAIPSWLAPVPEAFLQNNYSLKELTWEPRPADEDSVVVKPYAFENLGVTRITFPEDKDIVLQRNAFSKCNQATEISWPEKSKVIIRGWSVFEQCQKLPSVTIPDYMESLPQYTFNNCRGIVNIDLGKGLKKLDNYCFNYNTSLKTIKWSPALESIGGSCFSNSGLETLDYPSGIGEVPFNCFSSSSQLTKVTLPDDIEMIGSAAFGDCVNLSEINFPASLRTIGGNAFLRDAKLTKPEFNEGLERIEGVAFQYCDGLTTVAFPRSLQFIGNEAFEYCRSLVTVTSDAEDLSIGDRCFMDCRSLESFISTGHVNTIGSNAFSNLPDFTDFICPEGDYVDLVGTGAFENCTQLKAFPYLGKSNLGQNAFRNCTSLKSLTLPYQGVEGMAGNTITRNYIGKGYLFGATSVQSIVFPATAPYFHLYGCDISGAPLEAISYSYATDVVELYQTGSTSQERGDRTMFKYEEKPYPFNNTTLDIKATPEKSRLMVRRGEKWKYLEAGYGQLFTIDEMKEPQCNLTGDIFSTFDPEQNVNHYTVTLRWDVNLSDLNANGPTKMKIYREATGGDVLIADLIFSKPEKNPTTGDIEVDVTLNGKPNAFQGDFFYLADKNNNIYQTEYMAQGAKLIYDPVTEKRKELNTATRFLSWFCLVDKFDSPDLNDAAKVPSTYRYHGEIEGYDYTELVNNDNYEVDEATGLRYHTESRTLKNVVSPSTTVYTAMALPSPYFQGIYTTDDVKADTDFNLGATARPSSYMVEYNMTNPEVMKHQYRYRPVNSSYYTTEMVLSGVEVKDVTDPSNTSTVGKINIVNASASPSGKVNLIDKTNPDKRYQTVVTSRSRGTFGSPVVSMPDVPAMSASISVGFADHIRQTLDAEEYDAHNINDEGELLVPYTARITINNLDATDMGYAQGELTADDFVIALRRDLGIGPWTAPGENSARAAWDQYPETVLHFDGDIACAHDTHCPQCAAGDGVEASPATGTITLTDTYDVATRHDHSVNFTPRVYIKVPRSVNPGPDRWMIAEAPVEATLGSVTGVEDVRADGAAGNSFDPSQVRWFDLRGVEVKDPQPGTLYLRVTPAGTSKTVYTL